MCTIRFVRFAWIAGIFIAGIAVTARGGYAYVGSGDEYTKVLVEFNGGAVYAFGVSFSDPNTTGIGLFDIIEEDTTLETIRVDDPNDEPDLGAYIDGISYDGHSNSGWGGGELYWHYWVKGPATAWSYSQVGASSRIASDGGADGWIYGRDGAPRLPGDTGGDLNVNSADLSDFVANWKKIEMTWAQGDFTGDGVVNSADLSDLVVNWGFGGPPTPPPGSPPLPEPATAMLLAAGAMLLRRRRMK
jgi:hypothetical protein